MSELVSMLVPLETLSGWPEAPTPSPLATLGLLVGFPLLLFIIVIGIARIGNAAQAARGQTIEMINPVWVGGRPAPELESAETSQTGDSDDTPGAVGGAGARW